VELERVRDARHARRQLERQEQYLAALRRALRLAKDLRVPPGDELQRLITAGEGLRARFAGQSGLLMPSRRRATPGAHEAAHDCLIFLDECGAHSVDAPDTFPIFTLAAVIVTRRHYEDVLDLQWRAWKATNLGFADAPVHEPDVRGQEGRFAGPAGQPIVDSLGECLADAAFHVVACAIDRPAVKAAATPLDATLPDHMYLMALDMLFERIVLMLDHTYRGGRAEVMAESRGPREDALLQYEFARLQLDGTSYIGDAFFRKCLHPGISFRSKDQHCTGLQLADLVARPVAEKVGNPTSTPARWPEIREKLCPGTETKHSILGLKVFPWNEQYEDLWKS
jgi:hypothetical protein